MHDVVFERRVGAPRLVALTLLTLSAPAVLWAVLRWEAPLLAALDPISQAFGRGPVLGSVITLALAPLVALLVALVVVSRRFGRCVAGPDWLVFERALLPTWVGRTVALRSEVHDREPRADVVRVWLRDQRRNMPFIVPASAQAELEAALLELDRKVELEPLAAGRRYGRRDRWVGAGIVSVMYAFAAATMLVLERRLGEEWATPSLLGLVAFSLPLTLCLSAARAPWIRRVYVGRSGLAVGEELYTWGELTVVGVGERHLAVAAGSRTCLAWIGADEVQVREAIAARLAAAERPVDEVLGPLPVAVAGWRRRVRTLVLAAPAVLVPVGVLAAACLVPNYEMVRRTDTLGQTLYVLQARDADRPTAIVLVTLQADQPGTLRTAGWWPQTLTDRDRGVSSFTVDLGEGRVDGPWGLRSSFTPSATFVHRSTRGAASARVTWPAADGLKALRAGGARAPLSIDGVETQQELSTPSLLERLAEGVADEAVRAAALGWTTRRCFDVDDGVTRLVWGVDHGVVRLVVRAPVGSSWLVYRAGMGYEAGRGGRYFGASDAQLAISMDTNGAFTPDPTLPTSHADLLEVRRRVDAGERLADVLTR